MRILQVHNFYRQGGGEDTVVRSEAALLRAAGHEVVEYQAANPPGGVGAAAALAVSTWNPMSARSLANEIAGSQFDAAHVHNTWYRLSPAILQTLRKRRIPIVATVHNYRLVCANALLYRNGKSCTDCVGTHPWRGVAHRCYRGSFVASAAAATSISLHRLLRTWSTKVDRFIVATDYLGDMLVEAGIPRDRLRRIPLYAADPGERVRPPSESNAVLLVGRLDAEKGSQHLFRLWQQAGIEDLELRVIGDGPDRAALEAMRLPKVRFMGWMDGDAVQKEMLTARALVFPSPLMETFGLGMVEAMAAAIPVVANDVGTRPEVVGRDGAGWLVTHDNEWLEALHSLRDDKAVDAAGAAARSRYVDNFNPKVTVAQLIDVYREL